MRLAAGFAGLALTGLLAACQTPGEDAPEASAQPQPPAAEVAVSDLAPEPAPEPSAALPVPDAALPVPQPVPHIYLSLQPQGEGRPVSAIFAIDAARDNDPSNDQAIRLTPDGGRCNPQEMRRYSFPAADAARPVTSQAEQARGLTAENLPEFMAVTVTDTMLARGLATTREETRALNICTRKLWEQLVLTGNQTGNETRNQTGN